MRRSVISATCSWAQETTWPVLASRLSCWEIAVTTAAPEKLSASPLWKARPSRTSTAPPARRSFEDVGRLPPRSNSSSCVVPSTAISSCTAASGISSSFRSDGQIEPCCSSQATDAEALCASCEKCCRPRSQEGAGPSSEDSAALVELIGAARVLGYGITVCLVPIRTLVAHALRPLEHLVTALLRGLRLRDRTVTAHLQLPSRTRHKLNMRERNTHDESAEDRAHRVRELRVGALAKAGRFLHHDDARLGLRPQELAELDRGGPDRLLALGDGERRD